MVVLGPSGVSFPNELLLLLYLLLGAQDACRLSQVSRAWQQFSLGQQRNVSAQRYARAPSGRSGVWTRLDPS